MRLPTLPTVRSTREVVESFRGYNHNLRLPAGALYDMENLSSDQYPVLAPRGKRGIYARPASPQGLIAKDKLCYVNGSDFVMGDITIPMNLSTDPADCPKQLVSMGAYVIILPDKCYVNTLNPEDRGSLDAEFTCSQAVTFRLCNAGGEGYEPHSGSAAPEDRTRFWLDTSRSPAILKGWSESAGGWIEITEPHVRIESAGIGIPFSAGDGVSLSGISDARISLEGSRVILSKGEDFLVFSGMSPGTVTLENCPLTVARKMPRVDFVTESGNRLWGCRYGLGSAGQQVNEIYASKLGDFKNWSCFQGLSTDSYAASCGTDGPFTGAITHMGYPLFWKENCVHKVYGSYPAQYQIQDTACRGVQKGCGKSLAIVNETLFYKSSGGICAFDGSLPTEVSYAFGGVPYRNAVAGAAGSKYYVSMEDGAGKKHLFVYDTAKGLWHREDDLNALAFCGCGGELYCIDGGSRNILALLGSGEPWEEQVSWMAETGELGLSDPDMKYISRMVIRMSLDMGSRVDIYARYDLSDEWIHLARVHSTGLRSFSVPIRPRRCDHMKLRIVGVGGGRIYSLSKNVEKGGFYR